MTQMRGADATTRRKRAIEWLNRLEIGEFAERDIGSLSEDKNSVLH